MMPKDRREYYKEWRNTNKEHVKNYIEDKYKDYAEHSANYRIKHPERVLCSMAKRRAKEKGLEFNIDNTDIKEQKYGLINHNIENYNTIFDYYDKNYFSGFTQGPPLQHLRPLRLCVSL